MSIRVKKKFPSDHTVQRTVRVQHMDSIQESCEEDTRFHDETFAVTHEDKWQDNVNNISFIKHQSKSRLDSTPSENAN